MRIPRRQPPTSHPVVETVFPDRMDEAPIYDGPLRRRGWLITSILLCSLLLAACPKPPLEVPTFGAVELLLEDSEGQPARDLIVELDGTTQRAKTDPDGLVRFAEVPGGRQSFSILKQDPGDGREVKVEAAVEVVVEPGGTIRVRITVTITIAPAAPAACAARPWCGVVGSRQGPNGTPRVVIGGGVRGNCACNITPAGLALGCPGRKVIDPAPLGVHTVTVTTCLGGAGCAGPAQARTCAINL